jgi:hypothetical protein
VGGALEWTGDHPLAVHDDGEFVRECDARPGSDERLRLHRLVAMAGQHDRRSARVALEDVVHEPRGRAVVCANPCLGAEVVELERRPCRQRMVGGKQHADRVLEERHQLDLAGRRLGLEVVLVHDRHVELAGRQPPERLAAIDERVDDHEPGVPASEHSAGLRGEVDERGEEGAEADPAATQPGDLGDLLLGQRQARQDRLGVVGEQLAGLRGVDALACAPDELRADLALEQRDLP